MLRRYWDKIEDGETLPLGAAVMSREEIVQFASEFDPQPFHVDDLAARATLLGGLAASGWHTCVVVMDLVAKAFAEHGLEFDMPGVDEIMWLKPVRPDDVLSGRLTLSAMASCPCTERLGVGTADIAVYNQSRDLVMRWRMPCVLARRPAAPAGPEWPCPLRRARPARVRRRRGDHAIKYFEAVTPGDEIALGTYEFAADRIGSFRTRYETAPSCSSGSKREPLNHAPGWHVTAAWMHCIVRYYRQQAEWLRQAGQPVPLLGPAAGVKHLRWHAAVTAGEVITFSCWAERKIEVASRGDWGLLVAGAEGVNRLGEVVVSFFPLLLLQRIPRRIPSAT